MHLLMMSFREGINIFLAGFVPTENLRFREESLSFKLVEQVGEAGAGAVPGAGTPGGAEAMLIM
jgi:translation initiation factor RLI1